MEETQLIMMTDEEKRKLKAFEAVVRFREKMGSEYSNYMKPYLKRYNAKEETKALRKIKNAEYYQRKKNENLNIAIC